MRDNRDDMREKHADKRITRRRMLRGAGGLIAAAAYPAPEVTASSRPLGQAAVTSSAKPSASVTARLARYMVDARDRPLPPQAMLAA